MRTAIGIASALAMLGTATTAGCASMRADESMVPLSERTYSLLVINQNFNDATLTAIWSGRRVRLGRVEGNSTETFELKWEFPTVQIEIVFLAGGRHLTHAMILDPEDELELVIDPNLHRRED